MSSILVEELEESDVRVVGMGGPAIFVCSARLGWRTRRRRGAENSMAGLGVEHGSSVGPAASTARGQGPKQGHSQPNGSVFFISH